MGVPKIFVWHSPGFKHNLFVWYKPSTFVIFDLLVMEFVRAVCYICKWMNVASSGCLCLWFWVMKSLNPQFHLPLKTTLCTMRLLWWCSVQECVIWSMEFAILPVYVVIAERHVVTFKLRPSLGAAYSALHLISPGQHSSFFASALN